MKRDRGSEKGLPTYTHTAHTHTHPRRSELPPATRRPEILKKFFFRPPSGRGEMIFRDCMSVCMVYRLKAQKKIKIKNKKEEERRLEGRREKRIGRRATHLFRQENNQSIEELNNQNIRELKTVNPSKN